jgi:ATP-dependent DNA helicase PIF1
VKSKFCFENLSSLESKQIFGSIPLDVNLWSEFEFCELKINQRQINDKKFADMLERIRIGKPNPDDINDLEKRLISNLEKSELIDFADFYLTTNKKHNVNLFVLFSRIDDVNRFNNVISEKLKINALEIKAIDNPKTKSQANYRKPLKKANVINTKCMKTADTAGLENQLFIGINSRVMLRSNIDVDYGLANGAIGNVTEIKYSEKFVQSIIIKFDNLNKDYELKRVTQDFEIRKNEYVSRSQFPLTLAWAITIHKVQGLSLEAIMADIGPSIFEPGMSYVALSRAKLLENVYLMQFDQTKIYSNKVAIREYNRLTGN